MPNITGLASLSKAEWADANGALFMHSEINSGSTATPYIGANGTLKLDASRSSNVYGNSDTVTPLSISTKLILKY